MFYYSALPLGRCVSALASGPPPVQEGGQLLDFWAGSCESASAGLSAYTS